MTAGNGHTTTTPAPPAAPASFEQLAERANAALDPVGLYRPLLDAARAAMNEVGIGAARHNLAKALDGYQASQAGVRAAQQAEQAAKAAYDDAVRDAEWEADDPARFVTEGNKTFLLLNVADAETGERVRRQVTADQRRSWVAAEAAKNPAVAAAADKLAEAAEQTAEARDAALLADKRLSAARHDLDAAAAQLAALTAALTTRTAR